MRLGSGIAVALAQAGGCSSYLTSSLGASMCRECSPKIKKTKKKKKRQKKVRLLGDILTLWDETRKVDLVSSNCPLGFPSQAESESGNPSQEKRRI